MPVQISYYASSPDLGFFFTLVRPTANMNDIKKMFILMIFARLRQPFSPKNNKKFPNKTPSEMFAFA